MATVSPCRRHSVPECTIRSTSWSRACALRSTLTRKSQKVYALKQEYGQSDTNPTFSSTLEVPDDPSAAGVSPAAPAQPYTNGAVVTEAGNKKARPMRKPRKPRDSGGTLGMDPEASFQASEQGVNLKKGTGGVYAGQRGSGLRPGVLLKNVLNLVPELSAFANLELRVVYNKDSSNVGPADWKKLATLLHKERDSYDAFLIIHGTDTMAYTASALSLMLTGFRKPIIVTGSQLPLAMPRSDARQNLIDAVTCLTAFFNPPHVHLREVAVCFGGRLMRGNRCQKTHSSFYQAFDSLTYPYLANLGVDVDWNKKALLQVEGVYRPRFELDPNVIRVPIVPGSDPNVAYGDLMERGVRGIVLETFGVGNMPDGDAAGWIPWLRKQRRAGLFVYLATQCLQGPLQPELYKSGLAALAMGVEAGPQMTPECAVIKMMQCLKYRDIPLGVPIAGEM